MSSPRARVGNLQVESALGGSVQLHYELYTATQPDCHSAAATNVLLIMGMGATSTCWQPQIEFLLTQAARLNLPLAVCAFDNRGVGRSTSPLCKHQYSSSIMASDALALMNHLTWQSAHVVAFSMGTQIACKLAAAAPQRVQSLTLIASVGGAWHVVPRSISALWAAIKCMRARTPEERAAADLKLHFTSRTLRTKVCVEQKWRTQPLPDAFIRCSKDTSSVQDQLQQPMPAKQKHVLISEYVAISSSTAAQPLHGAAGQMHAVWTHKLSRREKHVLATATFPKLFVHGRHDLVAPVRYAHSLAERLGAPFVELPGAHFVTRESLHQVNALLAGMIFREPSFNDSSAKDSAQMELVIDAGSLDRSESACSVSALSPHEEYLVVRPITPSSLHHRAVDGN